MKTVRPLKSVGAMLLTLALLFSMLSVGAFSVAADDVAKFTADFHQLTEDLKVNGNPTFPNFGGVLTIDAATEPGTQTWQGFVNDYLNSRWESRTSYGETLTRRWVCQQNKDLVTDGRTNHRFALSIDNLRYHIADIGGTEMIRRVDSLVFKADEKIAQFKNFEAELDFSLENSSDICGSMLFNFHESNPGHFVVKTADTAVHTGNTLVIGNPGKTGVDSWGFYPSTMETIPNKTIEDDDAPALEKGLGVAWSSFSQYYTLKVRAVNGTATFTLTSGADPTYIKTYTVTYPADGFGAISLGHSNRSVRYNNITLTELDHNGDPVDYGTFTEIVEAAANATKFTADFHQLTEDLKVNGNPTFPNFGGVLEINEATEPGTQTWQGFVNDYLNSRWESRTSYGETLTRLWVCQQNSDLVTDGRTNHRFALSIDNLRYNIVDVGGVEMIRRVDSLVFKADEKIAQFKNFEAELDFSLENGSNICGSMLFNFHESNPGHFVVKTADTAVHTGNTLVIGNPGKTGVDSWGFYPSTMETIPNKTIEDDDAPALEKNLGVTWSSFSQYYTLKVRAVNGTATFTLTSGADPTYIKTYTVSYPADGFGAISLGHSNRSVRYNNITLTELNDQGMPVNYGSFDPCANGHKFTKYVPNNDATCEKLPTETATCDYGCGTPDTRNVEGGAYGEHVVDAYTPNNDATCEKLPTETGTCTVCGDTVTRDVEGGEYGDHVWTDDADTECNECGEKRCVVDVENDGNEDKVMVTVAVNDGEEIKGAIWLVSKSDNNVKYPVVRAGFRVNANSDKYEVVLPEGTQIDLADFTLEYDIITPSFENPNVAALGASYSELYTGLRFINRFTRVVEDEKQYVVFGTDKYEVVDFGMIYTSAPGLEVDLGKDIGAITGEEIKNTMVVNPTAQWTKSVSCGDVIYDDCNAYIDIALTLINITNDDIDYYSRAYVIVKNGEGEEVLYGDVAYGNYGAYKQ